MRNPNVTLYQVKIITSNYFEELNKELIEDGAEAETLSEFINRECGELYDCGHQVTKCEMYPRSGIFAIIHYQFNYDKS